MTRTTNRNENSRLGAAATTAAVTAWGFGNVLVKVIPLSGPTISMQRLWLGTVLALMVLFVSRRRISWSDIRLSIAGGVSFGLNVILFFTAIKYTSPTTATVIETLQPALLLTAVGGFFGEEVGPRAVIGAIAALAGAVVVVMGAPAAGQDTLFGDFLAFLALLSYCAYFVTSKRARQRVGTVEYQVGIMAVAAVLVTPIVLLAGSGTNGSVNDWVMVLVMAAVPGGGHYLVNWAHYHTELSTVSILTLLTPVATMLAAYLMLGETVTVAQVVGTAVVIGALSYVVIGTQRS
ncbi:MAG: hypothetical protein EPN30_07475 [Actinomycetota bacterium]|nr:MAG: hypothetical protein EPN30_07475 [Actinomycetota bacterium]